MYGKRRVVLALVVAFDGSGSGGSGRRNPAGRSVLFVALAFVLAVPLVLLRSEGLLAVAGIAAALAVCSVRSFRPPRIDPTRLVTAVALAVMAIAAAIGPGLAKAAIAGGTDREASAAERLSDHAPVVVDYDLPQVVTSTGLRTPG